MQFKFGANVYTLDDKDVGTIKYIVVNPETSEVPNLVIQTGHLFTKERLIRTDSVYSADEGKVVLRKKSEDLGQLEEFEVVKQPPAESAEQLSSTDAAVVRYPEAGQLQVASVPRLEAEKLLNIPENTIVLKEGLQVSSNDGHHVGNLDRIYTAQGDERVSHLVITKGVLLRVKKLIPIEIISDMTESEIHLKVDAEFIDSIPEFQPEMKQGETPA